MVRFSHLYMTTGKTIAVTLCTSVSKVILALKIPGITYFGSVITRLTFPLLRELYYESSWCFHYTVFA